MRSDPKIMSINDLGKELNAIRDNSKKVIVQCHGVFDLVHIGHIRHFEEAKALGDILVVTVTPDHYVNKGTNRPAFSEYLRAEVIAALDCVDYVAINQWPTAVEAISILKPNIYAKGPDYRDAKDDITGGINKEADKIEEIGSKIIFTEDITFSSSNLINSYLPTYPEEVSRYLSDFSRRHDLNEVVSFLEKASQLNVLIIGETIIDEYQYCETIGKSGKEPILAAKYLYTERYPGGILAMANHLANFCDKTTMFTMVGSKNPETDFIEKHVNHNVKRILFKKEDSPTIVKRRFIENYQSQKLFEIYEINDTDLSTEQDKELCQELTRIVPEFDIVIVADYGHGMLSNKAVDIITKHSKLLSVNTQANAGNRGFNAISRYTKSNFICLASHEIALEERSRKGNYKEMILNTANKLDCESMIVTLGKHGSICFDRDKGFVDIPSFATKVIDTMGAGDAVLSLTSLCFAQKAPIEITGFIGNIAGAHAVETMGHSQSIEKIPFIKHIQSLMK